MEVNADSQYGGFVVSQNVIEGVPIAYSYREESSIPQLNGWTILSAQDDQVYVEDPDNFSILGATSMFGIAPVLLEIFDAPYGTDIAWQYEEGVLTGFYDLKTDQPTTIAEILEQEQ